MEATLNRTEDSPFFNPLEPGWQLLCEYQGVCNYDFYQTGDPARAKGCGEKYYKRDIISPSGLLVTERKKCRCMIEWEEQNREALGKETLAKERDFIKGEIDQLFNSWDLLIDEAYSDMRFEKFKVEDQTHQKAVGYLKAFVPDKNKLCLFGRPGRGKTHLAISLGRKLKMQGYSVLALKSIDLLNRLRRCYSAKEETDEIRIMKILKQVEVLIIDDIGTEKPNDWVRAKFYEIIDFRLNRKTTIFTTNLEGEEMEKKLGAALTSRVYGGGPQLRIGGNDHRIQDNWLDIGREVLFEG